LVVIILVYCRSLQEQLVEISVQALDLSKCNQKNSFNLNRRSAIALLSVSCSFSQPPPSKANANALALTNTSDNNNTNNNNNSVVYPSLKVVTDPETYSALSYAPSNNGNNNENNKNTPPLILVLHGAGKNDNDILRDLANPTGEHAGLIPSLIASNTAPSNLLDNFCILAPYSFGKPSFYNDPRQKLLQFVDWAIRNQNTDSLPLRFDPQRIILFGFSDGATVAIELLTTKRFAAGVICSYGYSGKALPSQALDRLTNIPMWVFHSSDDVIFDVRNSDRLVQQLETVNSDNASIVKYSRYDSDPEHLPPRVKGHSMGITASKSADVYDWMMRQGI